MNDFIFLRPQFLYLFILFALIFVYFFLKILRKNNWKNVCSKELLPFVVISKRKKNILSFWPLFVSLFLMIIGMAGPSFKESEIPVLKEPSSLVVLLDLSSAMNAEDIKPSRLKSAIYKVHDLLEAFKTKQMALVVFSEKAFVVTPLTDDRANIEAQLGALSTSIMPSNGHAVHEAIKKGADLLSQTGIKNGSLLLITGSLSNKELEKSLETVKKTEVQLSLFGVGHDEKTAIAQEGGGFLKDKSGRLVMTEFSENNLKQLAHAANGIYAKLSSDESDILALKKHLVPTSFSWELQEKEQFLKVRQDEGYLFALLAIPFIALIFRKNFLMWLFIVMPHLLLSADQKKAEEYYELGEYAQAKDLFEDEGWRACAHYKLGEFEQAIELFKEIKTADGFYNLGNSKAKLGQFEQALEAYEAALAIEEEHEDAKYNKKIVEDFLKQQEEKEKQQNQDKQEQNDKDQNNQGQKDKEKEENQKSDQQDTSQEETQEQENDKEEKNQEENSEECEEEKAQENNGEEPLKETPKEPEEKQDRQQEIDARWLKRIKDDPGELLRRKFLQQYKRDK